MASPVPIGTNGTFSELVVGTTATTISTYTVPSTDSNRGLFVLIAAQDGNDTFPSGITWNGTSMAKDVSVTGVQLGGGVLYFLANPDTGNNSLVISYSSAPAGVYGIIFTMKDVKQTTSIDATSANANTGGATTISSSNTTTVDNDVVIGWALIGPLATSISSDVGTTLGNATNPVSSRKMYASYIEKATAGSQSMAFNWTTSQSADMYMASYKYEAGAVAGATRDARMLTLLGVG